MVHQSVMHLWKKRERKREREFGDVRVRELETHLINICTRTYEKTIKKECQNTMTRGEVL
jgi:hypothetical protein